MTSVPIDAGLFSWPDQPRLLGSSCPHCSTTTFPAQKSCPRCTRTDMAQVPLAPTGKLWSFTVQGFEPKPPYAGERPFRPYGVGYVELAAEQGDAVLVEGRLTSSDPEELCIGDEMEVCFVPLRIDESGRDIITFAFSSTGRGAALTAAEGDR